MRSYPNILFLIGFGHKVYLHSDNLTMLTHNYWTCLKPEIYDWLENETFGKWKVKHDLYKQVYIFAHIRFSNKDDAIRFKLTWS